MKELFISLIILAVFMLSCGNETVINEEEKGENMKALSVEAIEKVASKKIFFGHMSVGLNILEGLKDLQNENSDFNKIKVIELNSDPKVDEAGLYHKKVGYNAIPKGKCDTFESILSANEIGEKFDVAFLKFCYVDFNKETSVKEIYDYYVRTVTNLKSKFPYLQIVHITVPLVVHSGGIKKTIKNLIYGDIPNIKRNKFNALLKNKFAGKDPILDLAAVESTYPDGKREYFEHDDDKVYALIPGYTYDGGHLNKIGRFRAANELIKVLSKL
jgi:hypothetical protein